MSDKTLYRVEERTVPHLRLAHFLYWKSSGRIIHWSDDAIPIESGEQAKIAAGEWALKDYALSAESRVELEAHGYEALIVVGGRVQLAGEPTFTEEKPTVKAAEIL